MTWTLVGPTGPSVHDAHSRRRRLHLPSATGTHYVAIPATRSTGTSSGSTPATTIRQQGQVTATLPQTGTYRLDVHSPSGSTFDLSLSIPRR